MNGDPAIEAPPQVDSFSLFLPLPYRVAIIIVLGVWAWGMNLHYLHLVKIDVPSLIRYPGRSSPTHPPHHLSTYRVATVLTIPLVVSLLLFWAVTQGDPAAVANWSLLPNFYLLVLVLCFALPLPYVSRSGRYRTLTTLKRISVGGIAEAQDGKFGDILLADALTSYAKVLGDLFISLCMFFSAEKTNTMKPDRQCGGRFWVPFIIAVPSMIRLRQCLIEYFRVRRSNQRSGSIGSHGLGGQHLANALKYSSAFPVIILSALQRDPAYVGLSETALFRLWLLAVLVNSLYSFYWDVAKDWDLTLFSALFSSATTSTSTSRYSTKPPALAAADFPYGLRRHRYFRSPPLYYGVVGLDLVLRCTWSLKLSPHLDRWNDVEAGIFAMQVLEVFRRWVWIFFRVETEWVRNVNAGPAPDDILLGDYHRDELEEYED